MSTLNLAVVRRHPYSDAQNAVCSTKYAHVSVTELTFYRYMLTPIERNWTISLQGVVLTNLLFSEVDIGVHLVESC